MEDSEKKFDLERVLKDDKNNTYYNLHGSIYYDLDFPGKVKLSDKVIYNFGHGASDGADDDKRTMINSNIISGFNKSSRILTVPYSQFYHKFYGDCIQADTIYIIGYSFGDTHINNAIKTATSANSKAKVIVITYMVYDNEDGAKSVYDWIHLDSHKEKHFLDPNSKIYEIVSEENESRIKLYRKGIQQFLEKKEWRKIDETIPENVF